ncbi:MAG TPA: ABC transporter permease [Methanospirillum sp.]|uniref:ABC transporter permease n=1 Tax=Methanospirillum sp. TaxID=45200 RepID=UPI002D0F45C1|nr:ABC transporter permease [Methanospirillum sp.]HOJ97313.1 ABC transporter permease [Methanospirillum sp.]HOL40937.1 ABC transporter permease [Methanospirillum sp.]HPP78846.1 ABC transporter permease [Methanospirillum sp.]
MNPASFPAQMRRAWAIAKKDIRIYYLKGPVLIFGVFMPLFLFLAFFMGSRQLPLSFLISGLVGMTLFFTATAVSPAIFPWEGSAKTLERLASCPITIEAIVFGDMMASIIFGIAITVITVLIGLGLGLSLLHGITLLFAILIGACCFSAIGMLLAVPPSNVPSNIMMLSSLIKFPLVFISGIFVPLEQMPAWGQMLAVCSPLTYFTDLVRYSFTDSHFFPVMNDIIALMICTFVFTVGTMYLHKRTMPKRM